MKEHSLHILGRAGLNKLPFILVVMLPHEHLQTNLGVEVFFKVLSLKYDSIVSSPIVVPIRVLLNTS